MNAREIETYLAELGAELKRRGVKQPIRLMLIGGAYMLVLEHASRTTEDLPEAREKNAEQIENSLDRLFQS